MPELQTLKVVRFQRSIRECPKCGHQRYQVPAWIINLLDLPWTCFSTIYCRGGQSPIKSNKALTFAGPVDFETNMPCAGITEDHLHVTCKHCNFFFLMMTQDRK